LLSTSNERCVFLEAELQARDKTIAEAQAAETAITRKLREQEAQIETWRRSALMWQDNAAGITDLRRNLEAAENRLDALVASNSQAEIARIEAINYAMSLKQQIDGYKHQIDKYRAQTNALELARQKQAQPIRDMQSDFMRQRQLSRRWKLAASAAAGIAAIAMIICIQQHFRIAEMSQRTPLRVVPVLVKTTPVPQR
jgi:chromosome segregation ATPase